jgi:hypothetical protein
MNRPYTAAGYSGIVSRLRKAVPDIAISTDIMVGFPGEKDANFQNTLNFVKEIRPMRLHVFGFSKRIGTPAYNYKDNINSAVKKKREHLLMDTVEGFSREFEKMFIGKTAKVLIEGKRDKDGFLHGYTDRYINVLIPRINPRPLSRDINSNCFLLGRKPQSLVREASLCFQDNLISKLINCQLTLTPPFLTVKTEKEERAGLTNQKVYGILPLYSD